MDDNRGNAKRAARITKIGLVASGLYVGLVAIYVVAEWNSLLKMKPNEFGDFLAGVFGPLALGWLVCGYFQQGIELRQNTEALTNQVEELRASVAQQTTLAKANEEILEHQRSASREEEQARMDADNAKFYISHFERYQADAGLYGYVKLGNSGASVWPLEVSNDGQDDRWDFPKCITSNDSLTFVPSRDIGVAERAIEGRMEYQTKLGYRYELRMLFKTDERNLLLRPELIVRRLG